MITTSSWTSLNTAWTTRNWEISMPSMFTRAFGYSVAEQEKRMHTYRCLWSFFKTLSGQGSYMWMVRNMYPWRGRLRNLSSSTTCKLNALSDLDLKLPGNLKFTPSLIVPQVSCSRRNGQHRYSWNTNVRNHKRQHKSSLMLYSSCLSTCQGLHIRRNSQNIWARVHSICLCAMAGNVNLTRLSSNIYP